MLNLKPCPFCGGRVEWCKDTDHGTLHECHYIVCAQCTATVDFTPTTDCELVSDLREACAELWNLRNA